MNPKMYKKPADLMKTWELSNLVEYKSVIMENIDDIKDELQRGSMTKTSYPGISVVRWYKELEKKLKHNENMLVVVNQELETRY
jgi:hypothetical protein